MDGEAEVDGEDEMDEVDTADDLSGSESAFVFERSIGERPCSFREGFKSFTHLKPTPNRSAPINVHRRLLLVEDER